MPHTASTVKRERNKETPVKITITPKMKRILAFIALPVLLLAISAGVAACTSGSNGGDIENAASSAIQSHYDQVQPVLQPTGQSVYRATLTYVEAQHILGLNTESFLMRPAGGDGAPVFQCPSEGAAIANTAELDNPQEVIPDPYVANATDTVGNMDPDGVYPPADSQGTYIRCLLPGGSSYLVYSEPDVIQFNATNVTWNPSLYGGQGGFQIAASSITAMPVCQVRYENQTVNTNASSGPTTQQAAVTNCKAVPGTVRGNGK
jgi:hypothetical protein